MRQQTALVRIAVEEVRDVSFVIENSCQAALVVVEVPRSEFLALMSVDQLAAVIVLELLLPSTDQEATRVIGIELYVAHLD